MPMKYNLGSDCGSVGRAVSFDTRDPQFESSDRQILFTINCCIKNCNETTNIKEKEAGNKVSLSCCSVRSFHLHSRNSVCLI